MLSGRTRNAAAVTENKSTSAFSSCSTNVELEVAIPFERDASAGAASMRKRRSRAALAGCIVCVITACVWFYPMKKMPQQLTAAEATTCVRNEQKLLGQKMAKLEVDPSQCNAPV